MPSDMFPCPACRESIDFPVDSRDVATCLHCAKTWKAGTKLQQGVRMALANEGQVRLILWHEQVEGLGATVLVLFVPLAKVLFCILFVVLLLAREGISPNWPVLTAVSLIPVGMMHV